MILHVLDRRIELYELFLLTFEKIDSSFIIQKCSLRSHWSNILLTIITHLRCDWFPQILDQFLN